MSDLDIEVQNFTADLVAAMLAARKRGLPQTMISEALRKEADTLRCPCCGEVLKESTEKCKYETLIDHVEDPNRDSPERTFFFCHKRHKPAPCGCQHAFLLFFFYVCYVLF